jgi:hypothetical protein|tara:strand:+ start:446 stop:934 length:489 start_codon:yes stop_codon:yes gene_type:complete
MSREVKIETYFLEPPYKIVEHIASYGDEQDRIRPVNADMTNWHLETDIKFKPIIDKINENYPQYTIKELWGNTYRQGDYAKTHNHFEYVYAFVWFVDTHTSSSPIVFPNIECPWEPPLAIIRPERGKIVVFDAEEHHYVPPITDGHKRVTVAGNMILNKKVH